MMKVPLSLQLKSVRVRLTLMYIELFLKAVVQISLLVYVWDINLIPVQLFFFDFSVGQTNFL